MHKKLFAQLLKPRSPDEDSQRKEFILNVLLLSSMLLFALASILSVIVSIIRPIPYEHNSVSIALLLLTLLFFTLLYLFSRKGSFRGSAYALVIVFFLFGFLMGFRWGVDVNASLLIYALVIVMAGILIDTKFAFIMSGAIVASLFAVGQLQAVNAIGVDRYWRTQPWEGSDTVMTVIIFLIIAVVSWLSNREIERSLARAHRSEDSLRKERDRLEITVEERTRELREAQLEKISQLYRFAEFGRLSSGLFHDLMNPLNAVSLNVEKAKSEQKHADSGLSKAEYYLDQAFAAAQRMEKFITAVRKQIARKGNSRRFSPAEETESVIDLLSYKALLARVRIILHNDSTGTIVGDPIEWSQIMLNLISNAIDAYDDMPDDPDEKTVTITFTEDGKTVVCTVADHGIGIPDENKAKIFEPFFTTKAQQPAKGTGIGLSIVKTMIEKNFAGSIAVESAPHVGTVFTLVLPT